MSSARKATAARWMAVLGLAALASAAWVARSVEARRGPGLASATTVTFAPREARFVRIAIDAVSDQSPAIDEVEIYGPASDRNLAREGATATASSCIQGFAIHSVANLIDGHTGNSHSWVAASPNDQWVQVALPAPTSINRVVFSRDREGGFTDRTPIAYRVQVSDDGVSWATVKQVKLGEVGPTPAIWFRQEHARHLRLRILSTVDDTPAALGEIAVYGKEPGVNVAAAETGARSQASSGDASLLNDGAMGEGATWSADAPGPQWVQIDLPTNQEVNRLVYAVGAESRGAPQACELEISIDGRRWKTIAETGAGAVPPPAPPLRAGAGEEQGAPLTHPAVPSRDDRGFANLALGRPARASSSMTGIAFHKVEHLTDGQYGNEHSWISGGDPSWAEVDLGSPQWVTHVALGSDSMGKYADRAAVSYSILAATTYNADTRSPNWTTVARRRSGPAASLRTAFRFRPIQARWVRVAIDSVREGACRIDELEVYGAPQAITTEAAGKVADWPGPEPRGSNQRVYASFLGDEYEALKQFGRADLDAGLTGYVRVWQFPDHVPDDSLPLPELAAAPPMVPGMDLPGASRGEVCVAAPEEVHQSPLVQQAASAGIHGGDLYLSIRASRLLSGSLAVLSSGSWRGCGVLVAGPNGLVLNQYRPSGGGVELAQSTPVQGTVDAARGTAVARLPLSLFPDWRLSGIRVGLGLGGRHTSWRGHGIAFTPAGMAVAQVPSPRRNAFRLRLSSSAGGSLVLRSKPGVQTVDLRPGESREVDVAAVAGPLGPEANVAWSLAGRGYALHLFRYRPAERSLQLIADAARRLQAKGVSVAAELGQMARLRARQDALDAPGSEAERLLFLDARMARRMLVLRDPDLRQLQRVLCVRRNAFEPSHNYSDLLDNAGGPGGSVEVIRIPMVGDRLAPESARLQRVFDSANGISRDPVVALDGKSVYWAWCRAKGEPYHLMQARPDGAGLRQVTGGPFSDFFPCPLPDGGMAFMSTRCRQKFLCWRPQAYVLFRMDGKGRNIQPLSHANLSEWAPGLMADGRILWTRSEYQDKGADFSHTLWAIKPDGTEPDLVFGNSIIQPNGYANGREVPGTREIACTLISHFGDLNGPIALIDTSRSKFDAGAIKSITPEVPWPGIWPGEECFRDPTPISRDWVLCSHAPGRKFGVYIIDRYGNREMLADDPAISMMCPTPVVPRRSTPTVVEMARTDQEEGEFILADVYQGLGPNVKRGSVAYLRVNQEVRANLERLPNGSYRADHPDFEDWYATPIHLVSGPYGWPTYVAKGTYGMVPVSKDGSVRFKAPAGKVLYFSVLDKEFNEIQRMRSVVQLQPGEKRSCIGCHEGRSRTPLAGLRPAALPVRRLQASSWEGRPFSYEDVVQPVLDHKCGGCHGPAALGGINLTGDTGRDGVPASYRTLVSGGWIHYIDWSYNPGGNEKVEPLTFGTVRSKLWKLLDAGHHNVTFTADETQRMKVWIDLNCPLWPDYQHRPDRAKVRAASAKP